MTTRIACFGGIYNNYLALEAAIADAQARGVEQMFCLGDLGAFGPHPDRVFPLLHQHDVQVVRGNYDDSIGRGLNDCQCGYTDPRDNYFAQISYDYTLQNTSSENRAYLRTLPAEIRLEIAGQRILLCHGSPRRTNEFLWESTTSTSFLNWLADQHQADLILATHTGLHWGRELANRRAMVNVGVLGRPANDGQTVVWYAIITIDPKQGASWQFVPLEYDFRRLSREMAAEGLPSEFMETIETGWWSTCLEALPAKERRAGLY